MNSIHGRLQRTGILRSSQPEAIRQMAHWMGVETYVQQPWVKRLPGVLLATLLLTALLWAIGLPVWFLH